MHVHILSPRPDLLVPAIELTGDTATFGMDPPPLPEADWIVSFCYRCIIREPDLSAFAGRMINIHLSALPWNRGADPNFWSWFDGTPKGVSIHQIDAGIDTGPVLAQTIVDFHKPSTTLRSSYDSLIDRASGLFYEAWPAIRNGNAKHVPVVDKGSYHRSNDKDRWWNGLPFGLDTPVTHIEEMGDEHYASVAFCDALQNKINQAGD